eukprot:NODE_13_length_42895_cov_0.518413.p5 type:complete len:818 gc:universal NODE_13_length_42895_cov_0.518413:1772-4225(+)
MEEDFNLNPIFSKDELLQLNTVLVLLPTNDEIKQKIKLFIDNLLQREAFLSQKVFNLLESAAANAFAENNMDSADLQRKNIKYQADLNKAWKLLEIAHEREIEQNNHITDLTAKLDSVHANGTDLQLLTFSQENKELKLERNDFSEQARQLSEEKSELTQKLSKLEETIQISTANSSQKENDFSDVRKALNQVEYDLNTRDTELSNCKMQSDYKDVELKNRNEQLGCFKDEVKKIEKILEDERRLRDVSIKELEISANTIKKLESQVKALKKEKCEVESKFKITEFEMKTQEKEYEQITAEKQATDRIKESLTRKIQHFEAKRMEMKLQLDAREAQLLNVERQALALKDEMVSTKDDNLVLANSNAKLKVTNIDLQDKLNNLQAVIRKFELDISNQKKSSKTFQEEAIKMRLLIEEFEQKQDDYEIKMTGKEKQLMSLNEDVHKLKSELWEQAQKTGEFKRKLMNQQNLYEQARSDRNRYAKDVMDTSAELKDSRIKFESYNHQINQLEQQVQFKSESSTKDHFSYLKVVKEKENLVLEMDQLTRQYKTLKAKIDELKSENHLINQTSADYFAEIQHLTSKLSDSVHRSELQQQNFKEKSEQILKYSAHIESLEIQNNSTAQLVIKSDLAFKLLKEELKGSKKKIRSMELHGMNTTKLQQEIQELQRTILNEQLRNKALEEEMERPQNLHRWRSIQAVDPDKFLLMEKVADLQRRTIKKDDEILIKTEENDRLSKLNVDLKKVLSKAPPPEIASNLELLKSVVQKKTDEIHALESEIKMYRDDLSLKDAGIEELKLNITELKTRYLVMKRKVRRGYN